MKLWTVSTASFHTFLVRAETEAQAREVAMNGPGIDDACTGEELGYKEPADRVDPATWSVHEISLIGDAGVLECFS